MHVRSIKWVAQVGTFFPSDKIFTRTRPGRAVSVGVATATLWPFAVGFTATPFPGKIRNTEDSREC